MNDQEYQRPDSDLDRLERKIDDAIHRIDEECGRLSSRVSGANRAAGPCGTGSTVFWGGLMIVGGLVWLGDKLGWYNVSLPWGPVAIIVVGIWLVVKSRS